MQIYNTLTRKKEEIVPIQPGHIGIYACGPTVYNYIHIGNARPICAFDVLRRYLKYRGYDVSPMCRISLTWTTRSSKRQTKRDMPLPQRSPSAILRNTRPMHTDLNVMDADDPSAPSQNCMDLIIDMVKKLGGHAVMLMPLTTETFTSAPLLSRTMASCPVSRMEELQAGARIDVNDEQRGTAGLRCLEGRESRVNPTGIRHGARAARAGTLNALPCPAHYLGETFDLHCGGQDLIFPHHENEIAQSEAANGKAFAHYWMHNGYINIDNKKMSKSLGNFFTVREVAEQYGYEVIRYMMVQAHYRSPINYCKELLDACKASLERLYACRDTPGSGHRSGDVRLKLHRRRQRNALPQRQRAVHHGHGRRPQHRRRHDGLSLNSREN